MVPFVVRVQPRVAPLVQVPNLSGVAGRRVDDRTVGVELGKDRIVEAHDAADRVDAGLFQLTHEIRHVAHEHVARLCEFGDLRVERDATRVVLDVDDRGIEARALQDARDALHAERPHHRRAR